MKVALTFIFLLVALGVRPSGASLVLLFLLSGVGLRQFYPRHSINILTFFLGALVPLAPLLGSGTLLLVALVYLLLCSGPLERAQVDWAWPWLGLVWAGVLGSFLFEFDGQTLRQLFSNGVGSGAGSAAILRYLRLASPDYFLDLIAAARLLMMVLLMAHFASQPKLGIVATNGLVVGMFGAALLTLVQISGVSPELFENQTRFWSDLRRLTGTFSDPNAFGVAVVLILAVVASNYGQLHRTLRIVAPLLGVAWLILGAYSGSRSFFLGLGLLLWLWLWQTRRAISITLASLVVVLLIALNFQGLGVGGIQSSFPEGLRRVSAALSWGQLSETFHSRVVFTQIAFEMWREHPWLGVGFNDFREYVLPVAQTLGLKLGSFTDNANNFYLGILAEFGLAGFLLFVLSVTKLRLRNDCPVARAGVVTLAVLLLLGPHLDFDEVAVVVGLLFGQCTLVFGRLRKYEIALTVVIGLMVILHAGLKERGLYAWESDRDGDFRWTERRSHLILECKPTFATEFTVQSLAPDLRHRPVGVAISSPGIAPQHLRLRDAVPHSVTIPCPKPPQAASIQVSKIPVDIEVERIWVPAHFRLGSDERILGLRVRINQP